MWPLARPCVPLPIGSHTGWPEYATTLASSNASGCTPRHDGAQGVSDIDIRSEDRNEASRRRGQGRMRALYTHSVAQVSDYQVGLSCTIALQVSGFESRESTPVKGAIPQRWPLPAVERRPHKADSVQLRPSACVSAPVAHNRRLLAGFVARLPWHYTTPRHTLKAWNERSMSVGLCNEDARDGLGPARVMRISGSMFTCAAGGWDRGPQCPGRSASCSGFRYSSDVSC